MKITSFTGKVQLPSIFGQNPQVGALPAEIATLCEKFKHQDNLIDIIKIMNNNPGFTKQSPTSYEIDSHKIIIGTKGNLEEYKHALAMLNRHNLSCCPKLKYAETNKNKQYLMLVLRTPEKESGMKNFVEHSDNVDTITKCEFIQDLESLANRNKYYNPILLEEPDIIKVTDKGNLYVPDWSGIEQFATPQDKAEYFNQLRKLFNLVY